MNENCTFILYIYFLSMLISADTFFFFGMADIPDFVLGMADKPYVFFLPGDGGRGVG